MGLHCVFDCLVVMAGVLSFIRAEGVSEKDKSKFLEPPSDLHLYKESITANTVSFSFHPSNSNLCTGHSVTFTASNPKLKARQVLNMGPNARFGTVSGLFPGREYWVELVATGDHATSHPITEKMRTKPSVPIGPPIELSAKVKGSTWFILTWSAPNLRSWGEETDSLSYDLQLEGEAVLENVLGYSHNFTGLQPEEKYKVVVFARNSVGVCQERHGGVIRVTTLPFTDHTAASKHSEL